MYQSVHTSLHNKAIRIIKSLPDDKLSVLIQFADFLNSSSYRSDTASIHRNDLANKRKQLSGSLKGDIFIAPDFNETPDCFKEYM